LHAFYFFFVPSKKCYYIILLDVFGMGGGQDIGTAHPVGCPRNFLEDSRKSNTNVAFFVDKYNISVMVLYEFKTNEKMARATRSNLHARQRIASKSIPEWQAIYTPNAWDARAWQGA
jgi:hypothetical protein